MGLWTTAVVGSRALARVDEAIGSTLLPVVSALRHALFVGPPEATESGLEALGREVYSQPRDSAPPQVQFLGDLLVLVAGALAGDDQEALLGSAKDLDEMSGGEFELWELIGILGEGSSVASGPTAAHPNDCGVSSEILVRLRPLDGAYDFLRQATR